MHSHIAPLLASGNVDTYPSVPEDANCEMVTYGIFVRVHFVRAGLGPGTPDLPAPPKQRCLDCRR